MNRSSCGPRPIAASARSWPCVTQMRSPPECEACRASPLDGGRFLRAYPFPALGRDAGMHAAGPRPAGGPDRRRGALQGVSVDHHSRSPNTQIDAKRCCAGRPAAHDCGLPRTGRRNIRSPSRRLQIALHKIPFRKLFSMRAADVSRGWRSADCPPMAWNAAALQENTAPLRSHDGHAAPAQLVGMANCAPAPEAPASQRCVTAFCRV
jgi:hypothetical protein